MSAADCAAPQNQCRRLTILAVSSDSSEDRKSVNHAHNDTWHLIWQKKKKTNKSLSMSRAPESALLSDFAGSRALTVVAAL